MLIKTIQAIVFITFCGITLVKIQSFADNAKNLAKTSVQQGYPDAR